MHAVALLMLQVADSPPLTSALKTCFCFSAAEQVQFLENRKKQFLKAALQAKQKNDLDQAKTLLRKAKGLEPMIEAARSGRAVDISQVCVTV